jgi:hypothetical protein
MKKIITIIIFLVFFQLASLPSALALTVASPEGLYWVVQLPSTGVDPAPTQYEGDISMSNTTSCATDCWNITALPSVLTQFGSNPILGQLGAFPNSSNPIFLAVNGSSTAYNANTAPNVTPTGCGTGTVSDFITYPVTFGTNSSTTPVSVVPSTPAAIAIGTLSLNPGYNKCTLQFYWWLLVNASAFNGFYSGTLQIAINSGP